MGTRAQAIENLKKVNKKTRKPRSKGKKTVEKELREEKAREYFIEETMKALPKLTKKQIEEAMTDYRSRHYILDQVIGKPKEKLELGGEDGGPIELDVRILGAMKRSKKKHDNPNEQ